MTSSDLENLQSLRSHKIHNNFINVMGNKNFSQIHDQLQEKEGRNKQTKKMTSSRLALFKGNLYLSCI